MKKLCEIRIAGLCQFYRRTCYYYYWIVERCRPVSAYALFFRDTQAAIKCQNPSASFGEMSKIVAAMWDTLDDMHKNVSLCVWLEHETVDFSVSIFPCRPHISILSLLRSGPVSDSLAFCYERIRLWPLSSTLTCFLNLNIPFYSIDRQGLFSPEELEHELPQVLQNSDRIPILYLISTVYLAAPEI